jgi:hypothetical protein
VSVSLRFRDEEEVFLGWMVALQQNVLQNSEVDLTRDSYSKFEA